MRDVALIAVVVIIYSAFSYRLDRSSITPPMVFLGVGLLIGPGGLGWFSSGLDAPAVHTLAEVTLALLLFTDAARIRLDRLRSGYGPPLAMLGIGMPLTVLAGTGVGLLLFPTLPLLAVAALAAVLAPTDAALGQGVLNDERVPQRIRQTINVESGLNDGLALPILTFLLALATAPTSRGAAGWGVFVLRQVGGGAAIGALVGLGGGLLLQRASGRDDVARPFRQLATFAIAIAALALSTTLGANGFVAAFVAGAAFGAVARDHQEHVTDFAENEGSLLTLLVFLLFGADRLGTHLGSLTWSVVAYVALSLTVVRMVPIALSLLGQGLRRETVVFLGWFGPRGVASILFLLLAVEGSRSSGIDTIEAVVVWTVTASVVLHGLTARPLAGWYAGRVGTEGSAAEHATVDPHPLRIHR